MHLNVRVISFIINFNICYILVLYIDLQKEPLIATLPYNYNLDLIKIGTILWKDLQIENDIYHGINKKEVTWKILGFLWVLINVDDSVQ